MEKSVEDFPRSWAPKPYADLRNSGGEVTLTTKALCVFVHQLEDKNVDGLKALATKEEKSIIFFYATAEGVASRWSDCAISSRRRARRRLLDLDDDGAYYAKRRCAGARWGCSNEPGP